MFFRSLFSFSSMLLLQYALRRHLFHHFFTVFFLLLITLERAHCSIVNLAINYFRLRKCSGNSFAALRMANERKNTKLKIKFRSDTHWIDVDSLFDSLTILFTRHLPYTPYDINTRAYSATHSRTQLSVCICFSSQSVPSGRRSLRFFVSVSFLFRRRWAIILCRFSKCGSWTMQMFGVGHLQIVLYNNNSTWSRHRR